MVKLRHLLVAILFCSTLATICAPAQSSLTQIRDLITNSDGTPFNGMVVITWNGFSVPSGTPVSQLSASAHIYNGALSVLLVPTTTATAGTYYQVIYNSSDGTVTWTETWQVPPSTTALTLSQVRQTTTQGGGGTTGGGGSGQYATLPISISQVTNLSSSLSGLNSSVAGLSSTVNGLTTTVNGLSTTVGSNSTAIASLTSGMIGVNTTLTGLSTSLTNLTNTVTGLVAIVNSLSSGNSTSVYVDSQLPSGALNGTNTIFTLASVPLPSSSLALYRNGLLQAPSVDYTLSGSVVTFLPASTPKSTDVLQVFYRMPGAGGNSTIVDAEVPLGVVNGSNLAFTLVNAPIAPSIKLYKNGLLLSQTGDYTVSGKTLTFASAATPQVGDSLLASYRY